MKIEYEVNIGISTGYNMQDFYFKFSIDEQNHEDNVAYAIGIAIAEKIGGTFYGVERCD